MLKLIFQGFIEWVYSLVLECWNFFSTSLLDIMSLDLAYIRTHVPIINDITQVLLAVGWALLLGNLVFQALKGMAAGLGFEAEDPKMLFGRTAIFSFLLLASPQICEIILDMTTKVIRLMEAPDAIDVHLVDAGLFGTLTAAWLIVIIFSIITMFNVLKLLLKIAEQYVILATLTITAPLAFSMGGSRSTASIFSGWCRMLGSMCLLMVTNVMYFKMLVSVMGTIPSGLDVIPWIVLLSCIVKVAKKTDDIITRIGLNPAIAGNDRGKGRSLPGMLAYSVLHDAASQVTKTIGGTVGGAASGAVSAAGTAGSSFFRSGGQRNTSNQSNNQQSSAQQSERNSNHQTSSLQTGGSSGTAGGGAGSTVNSQFNQTSNGVANQTSQIGQSTRSRTSGGSSRKTSVPPGTRRSPSHVSTPGTGSESSTQQQSGQSGGTPVQTRTGKSAGTPSQPRDGQAGGIPAQPIN